MNSLQVESLGKRYWVPRPQGKGQPATSRLDRLRAFFSDPIARALAGDRELWALRDVSFAVEPGTVLGVIGSNGAGKSTLLKIVAKVISPTTGRVRGRGRVVSLLELGAGFVDESTARENIYMNAALNGIPRDDVRRRFDEIIEFAELQDSVDTRLQYFSSGQYLRLAFSVAVNMEPSVLLADEILAVGDMAFQERCLQKVRDLAGDTGLTVLFVSHDMEAVSRICDRVIWLKGGMLHGDGEAESVVTDYQNATWDLLTSGDGATVQTAKGPAARLGQILDVRLLSSDGREIGSAPREEDVYVRLRFRTRPKTVSARCSFELLSKGVLVFRSMQPEIVTVEDDTVCQAMVRIPANLLAETTYTLTAHVTLGRGEGDHHTLTMNKALAFLVYGGSAPEGTDAGQRKGVVHPILDWTMAPAEADIVRA